MGGCQVAFLAARMSDGGGRIWCTCQLDERHMVEDGLSGEEEAGKKYEGSRSTLREAGDLQMGWVGWGHEIASP